MRESSLTQPHRSVSRFAVLRSIVEISQRASSLRVQSRGGRKSHGSKDLGSVKLHFSIKIEFCTSELQLRSDSLPDAAEFLAIVLFLVANAVVDIHVHVGLDRGL